jgi:hypothetical protein
VQIFLLGTRLGRHRFDRLELVAADEIHAGQHSFELLSDAGLDLAPHTGERTHRPRGNPREIVKKPVLGLHRSSSAPLGGTFRPVEPLDMGVR